MMVWIQRPVMTILDRVYRLVAGRDRTTESPTGESGQSTASTREWSTRLFHCAACDVTVVCEECGSCPRCDGGVERVPTERDLGHV